jgi:hypothetical protein
VVIEAIAAQKGCAPLASVIDLQSGDVAENVIIDHAYDHRFDFRRPSITGEAYTVQEIDPVFFLADDSGTGYRVARARFMVIRATASGGQPHLFFVDWRVNGTSGNGKDEFVPSVGSHVVLAPANDPPGASVVLLFAGERLLHPDVADEARYVARQPATPPGIAATMRANALFSEQDRDIANGAFDDAIHMMVERARLDALSAPGPATVERCRAIARAVGAGKMTTASARAAFNDDCRMPSPDVVGPLKHAVPDIAGVRIGMTAEKALMALRRDGRVSDVKLARGRWCVADYLADQAHPGTVTSGHCPSGISAKFAGGSLLVFMVEDVTRKPGTGIVTGVAVNYPQDARPITAIAASAGRPTVIDGKQQMWCFDFACSGFSDALGRKTGTWLEIDSATHDVNLTDATVQWTYYDAALAILAKHGIHHPEL